MAVRLTVKMKGDAAGDKSRTVLLDDEEILFGRDATCQVVLAQMAVSRSHARISRDETLFFVEDLGSSYGTQINGQKLPKGEKRLLRNGDVIAIAQFDITFDRVADVSNDKSGKTMFVSRNLVKDVMKGISAGGENAYFRVMNGPREGHRIELGEGQEYVFGRDEGEADIVLNDDLVSRRHAKARRDWSGTHVEDLGSRNGIKVNKKKATRATLKDRDEVEIGNVRLLFIDPSEVRDEPVVLPTQEPGEQTLSVIEPVVVPAPKVLQRKPELKAAPEPKPEPEPEPEPVAEPEPEPDPIPELIGEQPSLELEQPADDGSVVTGQRKLIDFSNKQTLVFLAIGGLMVIVGVIVFVMLIVGA